MWSEESTNGCIKVEGEASGRGMKTSLNRYLNVYNRAENAKNGV
jgi:hypothetical protein